MKKGLAIALALVMMVFFVGCGLASQLSGTKWEIRVSETYEGMTLESVVTYDFQKGGDFVMSLGVFVDGVSASSQSYSGSWVVAGDELTINVTMEGEPMVGYFIVDIDGDTLTLTDKDDSSYKQIFTRVK